MNENKEEQTNEENIQSLDIEKQNIENEAPAEPVAPVTPAEPVAPVTPAEPVAPVTPAEPVAPVTPAEPVAPVTPVEPVVPVTPAEPEPEKKLNKKKKTPIVLFIILILIIGMLAFAYYFTRQPAFILKYAVGSGMQSINNNLTTDTVVGATTEYSYTQNNTTITAGMDYVLDRTNKQLNADINIKSGSNELFALNAYADKGSVYLTSPKLYDKTVKIDIPVYDNIFISTSDAKEIINAISDATVNSIEKTKLSSETVKLSIQSKETKVLKSTMTIDKSNYENVVKGMITSLKNNNNFISSLVNITGQSADKIISSIDSFDYSNMLNDNESIKISLYTKGITQEFAGIKLEQLSNTGNSYSSDTTFEIIKNTDTNYSYDYAVKTSSEGIVASQNNVSGNYIIDGNKNTINIIQSDGTNKTEYSILSTNEKKNNVAITTPNFGEIINYTELTDSDLSTIMMNALAIFSTETSGLEITA